MKYLRISMLVTAALLVNSLIAANLDDFYRVIYSEYAADSLATVFDEFLVESDSVEDIDSAVQLWNAYDHEEVTEHISKLYHRQPSDRNIGIARVMLEQDFDRAVREAKKLILLNRRDPMVYQALTLRYLYEFPSAGNKEDWTTYQNKLLKDSDYLYRYQELAPDDDFAVIGKTMAAMSRYDLVTARKMIDWLVTGSRGLSDRLDISYLVPDPAYFDLLLYYLDKTPENFEDYDRDTVYEIAEAVANSFREKEAWQQLIDVFIPKTQLQDLGVVTVNLLLAYLETENYPQALTLLSSGGLDSAVNLIHWWKSYFPQRSCDDLVNALHAAYPDDRIAHAAWLVSLEGEDTRQLASRAFIEEYPTSEVGYNILFDSWRAYFSEHEFLDPASDEMSRAFVDDLSLWDAYERVDEITAKTAVLMIMEALYYGERAQSAIRMKDLRPQWMQHLEIEFLMINCYFNIDDYDSVMNMLFSLNERGMVTLSELEALQTSENAIVTHKDWDRLMAQARSLEPEYIPENYQVEE